jgi:HAE1 family hydrophobic/amphiphilic exporter-1
MIVTYVGGSPVRLDEIATVIDSVEDDKAASWYNSPTESQRALIMMVLRQPGTNAIEVADGVKALFPSFNAMLPPTVKLNIMTDRAATIRESFEDVQFTMITSAWSSWPSSSSSVTSRRPSFPASPCPSPSSAPSRHVLV